MPIGLVEFQPGPRGLRLAYQRSAGGGPCLVWLCGFHSDMGGTKAEALHKWADGAGRAFLRFDYSGHGKSQGAFADGTIGSWLADTLAMLDAVTTGPLILVGSSMGGWLALLAARARPARVKGLVLIAPAPDFTERLMWPELSAEARATIMAKGHWDRPSAYEEAPTPITRALIEDGRNHLLLHAPIPFDGPVRILHGQADSDVPWRLSLELAERLTSDDVRVTFVKAGDHRLSTPRDIALLESTAATLCAELGDAW